jgi:multiple antibiotic resistance protein
MCFAGDGCGTIPGYAEVEDRLRWTMYPTPWRRAKCIVRPCRGKRCREGIRLLLYRVQRMNPVDFIQTMVLTFVTLFPVVNPIGDAPIFLSLTRRYPESAQKLLARKIAAYGFMLLAVSFLFGSVILDFFGISLPVIQIAGGLVLASTGWSLLNQPDRDSPGKESPETLEDALEHAFFPLTLPITVGPGCISIAITLGAHLRHQAGSGFEHGYPRHFLAALLGMFLLCLLVMVCYGNADRLVRMLGKSGTTIMTRLSAFILLAIGVQIMWNGLTSGLPEMFSKVLTH